MMPRSTSLVPPRMEKLGAMSQAGCRYPPNASAVRPPPPPPPHPPPPPLCTKPDADHTATFSPRRGVPPRAQGQDQLREAVVARRRRTGPGHDVDVVGVER